MKPSFLSLSAAITLTFATTAVAQFPSIGGGGRNATGTGNERGLGIGTYDTKTVTRDRVVMGTVHDKDGKPMPGAIVYLKNDTSKAVRSMTADETGKFRFPQLSRTVDYQLWAVAKDKKTTEKTVSQFDNRDTITRELSVE